jgi:DNA-binding transcriptional LysR family regulator
LTDNLAAIRIFIEIVKRGSFSDAARHMNMAASSVTRQINALEEALNARLLNRTTRQVSLTEAGQLYYTRAVNAVAEIDDMGRAISELDAQPRGSLKVTAPLTFGRGYIVPRLETFFEQYPDISLELILSDQVLDLVQDGFDAAVRMTVRLPDSTFHARKLHRVTRVICASPSYLEKHGTPETPDDLKNHQCLAINFKTANELWRSVASSWQFDTAVGPVDIPVSSKFQTNSGETVLEAGICGLGIVVLPLWQVFEHIKAGRLVRLFDSEGLKFNSLEYNTFLVYPSNRYLPPKVRAFSDYLAQCLKHDFGE